MVFDHHTIKGDFGESLFIKRSLPVRPIKDYQQQNDYSQTFTITTGSTQIVDLMAVLYKQARTIGLRSSVDSVTYEINFDENFGVDQDVTRRKSKLYSASPVTIGGQRARNIRLINNNASSAEVRVFATPRVEETISL